MPSFTKRAIRESFLKLLNQRPISQITVKDVVEDCGINRNSFYYHYQDLPALIEEVIRDETDRIVAEGVQAESIEACLDIAIDFALKNRLAVLHICASSSREAYERQLAATCEYAVGSFLDKILDGHALDPEDHAVLIQYFKCELYGQIMDWLNDGMRYDIRKRFHRLCELLEGNAEHAIRYSLETRPQ